MEINQITQKIIGCAFTVGNKLGCGFLEKVYENALAHELRRARLRVETQFKINVYYDGIVVREYGADFVVERCVLFKLKALKITGEKEIA